MAVKLGEVKGFDRPAIGIRDGMPGPLRKRAERRGLFEFFIEGLEAGDVGGECELAVADGERVGRIEFVEDWNVTRDERMAVYGGLGGGARAQCQSEPNCGRRSEPRMDTNKHEFENRFPQAVGEKEPFSVFHRGADWAKALQRAMAKMGDDGRAHTATRPTYRQRIFKMLISFA